MWTHTIKDQEERAVMDRADDKRQYCGTSIWRAIEDKVSFEEEVGVVL
jgi:hypothetical protein